MRRLNYLTAITFLWLGAVVGATTVSYAQDDAVPWASGQEIEAFEGRFSYDAYACAVVMYDNIAKTQEIIRVAGRTAVGATFRKFLAEDKETAYKLGPALSAEVSIFERKLQVQLFRSGMMLYEHSSRTLWWCWHSQERKVRASNMALSFTAQAEPSTGIECATAVPQLAQAAGHISVVTISGEPVVLSSPQLEQSQTTNVDTAVTLKDFAGDWIVKTGQVQSGENLKLKLKVRRGHIIGAVAGGLAGIDLWRLRGRVLYGTVRSAERRIPMSVELSSDKGQLILIVAPPQSEYDVALAWREGYKPVM